MFGAKREKFFMFEEKEELSISEKIEKSYFDLLEFLLDLKIKSQGRYKLLGGEITQRIGELEQEYEALTEAIHENKLPQNYPNFDLYIQYFYCEVDEAYRYFKCRMKEF